MPNNLHINFLLKVLKKSSKILKNRFEWTTTPLQRISKMPRISQISQRFSLLTNIDVEDRRENPQKSWKVLKNPEKSSKIGSNGRLSSSNKSKILFINIKLTLKIDVKILKNPEKSVQMDDCVSSKNLKDA